MPASDGKRTYSQAFGDQGPKTPKDKIKKDPFKAESPGTPYSPAVPLKDLDTPAARRMAQEETDKEEAYAKARKGIQGGRKTRRRSQKRRSTRRHGKKRN